MRRIREIAGLFVVLATGWSLAGAAQAETYYYDVLNRLTKVISDDTTPVTTYYCYDAAGNRTYVGTTVCPGGGGSQFMAMSQTTSLSTASTGGATSSINNVVPSNTQPAVKPSTIAAAPAPGS